MTGTELCGQQGLCRESCVDFDNDDHDSNNHNEDKWYKMVKCFSNGFYIRKLHDTRYVAVFEL